MTFSSRQDASVSEMWREITRGREALSDVMGLRGEDRFTTDEFAPAVPMFTIPLDQIKRARS